MTLVLRHNTVGNFEIERPDGSAIGSVWCRIHNISGCSKWIFHPYNDIQLSDITNHELRQIKVILENLNGA